MTMHLPPACELSYSGAGLTLPKPRTSDSDLSDLGQKITAVHKHKSAAYVHDCVLVRKCRYQALQNMLKFGSSGGTKRMTPTTATSAMQSSPGQLCLGVTANTVCSLKAQREEFYIRAHHTPHKLTRVR